MSVKRFTNDPFRGSFSYQKSGSYQLVVFTAPLHIILRN